MRRFFVNIPLMTQARFFQNSTNTILFNQMLAAEELFKKGVYKESAKKYTEIRRSPHYSPEKYVNGVQYMLSSYALTDINTLRSLYLSNPHHEFYKKHITAQSKNTSLHIALLTRQNDIARLVASQDTIRLCNIFGYTPIDLALRAGDWDFLHFVKKTFDISQKPLLSEVTMNILSLEPYPDAAFVSLVEDFFDTSNLPSRTNNGSLH